MKEDGTVIDGDERDLEYPADPFVQLKGQSASRMKIDLSACY